MATSTPEKILELNAGDWIIREGSPAAEIYLLAEGEADVSVRGESVGAVSSGDIIGLFAALLGSPRTASVRAKTPCKVGILPNTDLESFVRDNPAAILRLLRTLAKGTTALTEKYVSLKHDPVVAAIVRSFNLAR